MGNKQQNEEQFFFKSKALFWLIIGILSFIIVGFLSFLIIGSWLDISVWVYILILIAILILIIFLFSYFLIIKNKWEQDINHFLQNVFANNKLVYPLVGLKIINLDVIVKVKQEKNQINHYFSKLTYIIIVYFIIVFYAFFIYFLSLIVNLAFSQLFCAALLSAISSILAIFVGTYFTHYYQQWKNKDNDFKKQYDLVYKRLMMFLRFLSVSDLNQITFDINKIFIDYHFFPNYLLKWMNKTNLKHHKAILINELAVWKKYLNNLEYINDLAWIKCLYILIKDQLFLSSNLKEAILINVSKVDREINSFFNDQESYSLAKNVVIKQSYQYLLDQLNQKQPSLKQIRNTLKILNFIHQEKQLNYNLLIEEDLNLNIFQMNYLKILFTIIDY